MAIARSSIGHHVILIVLPHRLRCIDRMERYVAKSLPLKLEMAGHVQKRVVGLTNKNEVSL